MRVIGKPLAFVGLVAAAAVLAAAYGALHDQLSYTVAPEYFTRFKFVQFADYGVASMTPRVGAALVGVLATWWVGLYAGLLVAGAGLKHPTADAMIRSTLRAYALLAAIAVVAGVAGLVYGWALSANGDLSHFVGWWRPAGLTAPRRFLAVGMMHDASYLGGALGTLAAIGYQFRSAWRARLTAAAAAALVSSTTACFIPVNITERSSPPLWGELRRGDGTPATGSVVAVASANERDDTKACARSSVRATVDSAGTFQLPGTTHQLRWLMIVPAFERFGSSYLLCAGAADRALLPVYHGWTSLSPSAPGDTVACLEWSWTDRVRTACAKPTEKAVVTGGEWTPTTGASASGFYRLIRTMEGPTAGPDGYFERPRLVVQWVTRSAGSARDSVAATVMLPSGDVKKYRSLRTLDAPHLYKRNGRWCVTAGTTRWTMWSSDKAEVLAAVLGAPGEVQVVESCPVPAQPPS